MKPEIKKYISENFPQKSIKDIACDLGLKERKVRKFLERQKTKKKQIGIKEEARPPVKAATLLISLGLIVALGFIAYSNSLNGSFIWDDNSLVKNNLYIKNSSGIPKFFTQNIRSGAGKKDNSYRPLQMLSYAIDYSLWKLNVTGYHLTNMLLHILVALCLYWLVNILFVDNRLSLLVSLLFVTHPIHTEAVSYISGRADPLSAVFMLLCFIFYIRANRSKNLSFFIPMLFSGILALLSREGSLILPLLLLLYHYTFREKIKIREFLSIIAVISIYILLRLTVLNFHSPLSPIPTTLFQRILGFFVAIARYLKLLFLPFGLHMEYGIKLFNLTDPKALLGAIIFVSLILYMFKVRNTHKLFFFSLAWFFITLLPQSNLYPINAYMAEHWLYLPAIGFFLILANGLNWMYRRKEFRVIGVVTTISIIAFYSYLTIQQNNYWKEPLSFYQRTLKYATDSPRIYNNLAELYIDSGKYTEAIELCKKAIEINPEFFEAYGNLGNIYSHTGKKEEALLLYEKAIAIEPNNAVLYNNLGAAYSAIGKKEEAINSYKKAINLNPIYAEAYSNLCNVYNDMVRYPEAIIACNKALEINPEYAAAYNNLGITYAYTGKKKQAITLFKKALEINPNDKNTYNNLNAVSNELVNTESKGGKKQ